MYELPLCNCEVKDGVVCVVHTQAGVCCFFTPPFVQINVSCHTHTEVVAIILSVALFSPDVPPCLSSKVTL